MKFSLAIFTSALLATSQACYLTVHTSTVGNFNVQHSEPLDHNNAIQYVTWTYSSCTIKGNILNGCGVNVSSATGCGSYYFTIRAPGRFARSQVEAAAEAAE